MYPSSAWECHVLWLSGSSLWLFLWPFRARSIATGWRGACVVDVGKCGWHRWCCNVDHRAAICRAVWIAPGAVTRCRALICLPGPWWRGLRNFHCGCVTVFGPAWLCLCSAGVPPASAGAVLCGGSGPRRAMAWRLAFWVNARDAGGKAAASVLVLTARGIVLALAGVPCASTSAV